MIQIFMAQKRLVYRVAARSETIYRLSSSNFLRMASSCCRSIRRNPSDPKGVIECLAFASEALRRAMGLKHYPVQLLAGLHMIQGRLVEMQTGEGKTLTALLPAAFHAMRGKGCHVITANEYLADRDAKTLAPVYSLLGLSTGCVLSDFDDGKRREEYMKDITYSTASQVAFDFLRDQLKIYSEESETAPVQRLLNSAVIDEADSVLIDEARTPFIIGARQTIRESELIKLNWSQNLAKTLEVGRQLKVDDIKRTVKLTQMGSRALTLASKPNEIDSLSFEQLINSVEAAAEAAFFFKRDEHYIVDKKEIVLVDLNTGRKMKGRTLQGGLHQALEWKERIPISGHTEAAAKVTAQQFFGRYTSLCGMTGTARDAGRELKNIYGLCVRVVPTNRPCQRVSLGTTLFETLPEKWSAVARKILDILPTGRPILVGTTSVHASVSISKVLKAQNIKHSVLNAKQDLAEAEVVSKAGMVGKVTIATNMAGRGTDIVLDDIAKTAGGLHVIGTEMHSARRIDRQLIGRAARQGDPGSFEFILSLEDELFKTLSSRRRRSLIECINSRGHAAAGNIAATFLRRSQKECERRHTEQRRRLQRSTEQRSKIFEKLGANEFVELLD